MNTKQHIAELKKLNAKQRELIEGLRRKVEEQQDLLTEWQEAGKKQERRSLALANMLSIIRITARHADELNQ